MGTITDSPSSSEPWPGPSRAVLVRACAGEARARDHVVRELMPMAWRIARKFATPQHPAEDLGQVAGIGLLKAIDRFDPTRAAAFATYAHTLMTGEVRRHIRDSRMVRIPRGIYEQVPRFQRTHDRLRVDLGRSPSRDELAQALGVTKDEVIEIADAALHGQHMSLDSAIEDAGGETYIGAREDHGFEQVEAGADLAPMLSVLTPRERMIIDLRFTDGLSQGEIADGLGISQTQVSRLIRQALAKLSKRAGVPAV